MIISSELVQVAWRAGICPIVDGIVYGDGRIVLTSVRERDVNGVPSYRIDEDPASIAFDETICTRFSEMYEVTDYTRFIRVGCGETSCEGEGFVAVSNPKSGDLVWMALFSNSEAFNRCELLADAVVAMSVDGHQWRFPIQAPEHFKIAPGQVREY